MKTANLLCDPGIFEGNLHQLEKDFNLITLGLAGLSDHAGHEDDITTDQVDSILDYTCDLHGKLCKLKESFPEMLAAARATGRTKGGAAYDMGGSQNHEINFTEVGRAEDLHGDLRRGLKLVELSLLGIQDVTRGPHVDPDDLVPIVGFVMDLQEKLEQFSDAVNKIDQKQPA